VAEPYALSYIVCQGRSTDLWVSFFLAILYLNIYFARFKGKLKSYGEMVAGDKKSFMITHVVLMLNFIIVYKLRFVNQGTYLWGFSASENQSLCSISAILLLIICGYTYLIKKFCRNNRYYFLNGLNVLLAEIFFLNDDINSFFKKLRPKIPYIVLNYLIEYLKLYISFVVFFTFIDNIYLFYDLYWPLYLFKG